MARSTVKTKGCFEAAIGLTDAEARAIEKIAEAKGFKTTNTNNDYYRATERVLADAKAQRGAIIEQIAKLDPQAAKAYAPVQEAPTQESPITKDENKPIVSANTVFTEDAAAAARARLKSKLGRVNSGLDPEMMMDGITLAGYHIEKGARSFAAYAKAMLADLGDDVKPYLKSWYMGVKFDPRSAKFDGMTSSTHVELFDLGGMKSEEAPTVNVDATAKPSMNGPEGRHAIAQSVADHFIGGGKFDTIIQARKFISELTGEKIEASSKNAKLADETIEMGVVLAGREMVKAGRNQNRSDQTIYDRLVSLYNAQPNLSVRSSTSVEQQAYSTPVPIAFVASRLAKIKKGDIVAEPTAGNSALVLEVLPAHTVINELNDDRVENLKAMGFTPTQKNAATDPLGTPKSVDVAVMNPPFGAVKDNDGKTIYFDVPAGPNTPALNTREIDHAIVFNSLATIKDDGRAVLIVGGVDASSEDQIRDGYRGKGKREFYYKLYNEYKVTDHFTLDGGLYSRQGAGYPVDVIVIDGRGKSSRDLPAANLPQRIMSYDQLKEKLNEANTLVPAGSRTGVRVSSDPAGVSDGTDVATSSIGAPDGPGIAGAKPSTSIQADGQSDGVRQLLGQPAGGGAVSGGGKFGSAGASSQPDGATRWGLVAPASVSGESGRKTGDGGNRSDDVGGNSKLDGKLVGSGLTDRRGQEAETENQVGYTPKSGKASVGTLVPVNMRDAIQESLSRVADDVGDLDDYVAKSLGYTSQELGDYLSAEQIDALALAIYNAEQGKGFIIGDQTGIGKGRVNAAMIRYAIKKGQVPIFITEKPNLYADMIRDLDDIGMAKDLDLEGGKPNILMTNNGESIPYELYRNVNGEVVEHKLTLKVPKSNAKDAAALLAELAGNGDLGRYKVIFSTYSQLQSISGKATERQRFLTTFAKDNFIIFDESHNAGGTGEAQDSRAITKVMKAAGMTVPGRAGFARNLVKLAKGTFFSSATYAKRPDVMDLYSSTNMSLAVDRPADLATAIKAGGVPLQQAVATMLTADGQYIRRERTFAGVSYETQLMPIDRQTGENMAESMRWILAFSRAKEALLAQMQKEFDKEGAIAQNMGGEKTQVAGANFGSVMHNLIDQMLLALKVEESVKLAITKLKSGEKVVLTVSNTMGSFLKDYADEMGIRPGDAVSLSFKDLYLRYLDKQRKYKVKSPGGTVEEKYLSDAELGHLLPMHNKIQAFIQNAGFGSAPISPIDYMHNELRKAGYKTDEITGRTATVDYEGGIAKLASRTANIKQRLKAIGDFNSGAADVLILNQSGSTGLSLHASAKFKDQKKRHMIIVQAEKNIDIHMQMLGRVQRTGQVVTPGYTQAMADTPAEMRPAAVLSKKMAGLSANTTASRKSAVAAEGVVDFINEYGGQVAAEFLQDNPEVHDALGGQRRIEVPSDLNEAGEELIRKLTGYIPILPLKLQEQTYADLIERYNDLIARENSMGTNKLETKALDLDAKTLNSEKITANKGSATETSVFAEPANMEQVDVKRNVKPLTPQELESAIDETLNGLTPQAYNTSIAKEFDTDLAQYVADTLEKMAVTTDNHALVQGQKKDQLFLMGENIKRVLAIYKVGDSVTITDKNASVVHGVITGISHNKKTKNPAAGSAWKMTFALANGDARTMSVGFGQLGQQFSVNVTPGTVPQITADGKIDRVTIRSLFEQGTNIRREKRWMVTGNLLAGFSKYQGQIVSYTKADGGTGQGVLMNRQFDYKKEKGTSTLSFSTSAQAIEFLTKAGRNSVVGSPDRVLRIVSLGNDRYSVMVPSSKREGGSLYLDRGLLDAFGTDFYKQGQNMSMRIDGNDTLERGLKYLIAERDDISLAALTNQDVARKVLGMDDAGAPPTAFSRSTGQPGRGLEAFAKMDDLYALPKSKATDIEHIARDNGEEVTVRTTNLGSEKLYTVTFMDGTVIRITDRPANPYGQDQQIYGMELEDGNSKLSQVGRVGENPEDVPPTDDVWLDVSQNTPAKYGTIAYNIAATYAHNNGKIFIGDPYGLTDMALRRRTEQMLASALKFGTTAHLAPHQRQVLGDAKLGVPPLKWVYGDHVGNTERMIDVVLDSLDNAYHDAGKSRTFDPATGEFRDTRSGLVVPLGALSLGEQSALQGRSLREARSGWRTFARAAYLRSFRGANGRAEGSGILDRAGDDVSRFRGGETGSAFADPKSRIFYSRTGGSSSGLSVARVNSITQAIRSTWKNSPEIVVAASMADEAIPANVRAYNQKQMSLGATGDPQGFVYGGKVYLIADQLDTPGHVVEVLFHEALGHIGLRGTFGKGLEQVLNQVILARRAEVLAKAKQYGLSANNPAEMRQAAEEVLAEMAQSHPELGIVQRAIAAIRTWLRENIPQLKSMALTDAEVIRNFILPARAYVEQGGGGPKGGIAFSRGTNDTVTNPNDVVGNQGGRSADDSIPGPVKTPRFEISHAKMIERGADGNLSRAFERYIPLDALDGLEPRPSNNESDDGEYHKGTQITQPIEVKFDGDNNVYMVYSGNHRIAQARANGQTHILAFVEPDITQARDYIGPLANHRENPDAHLFSKQDANEPTAPDSGGADIRFSRSATLSATANKVVDKLNEHFSHAGTMNWWHKSFGSPYNLAQKSRPFKRVFTSAQDFLNDVSFYANEAADHAAKLLPKLENLKDIGKSPISAADNKAIEAPIFEGTLLWARDEAGKPVKVTELEDRYADLSDEDKGQMLMKNRVVTEAQLKRWKASQLDIYSGAIRNRFEATYLRPGVEWTDAELKSIFNLTPEQADLYHQFHAAVGTSLDNMAKSEMLRYGGKDVADLRDMVLDAASADDAAILLRDHLLELSDEEPDRSSVLTDMANGMIDRADKVNKLKKEGYAPLSRFGQYSVDVVVDGERQYFGLFETKAEANQMAKTMRDEFGADNVESGTVAQAKFEQYKGITPESLELFGNMLGLDSTGDKAADVVFQEYLKLTKNNRSAMKRLIHRKGIAGYSTDTGRVLAAFIYSNARQTAAGLHMGEMADALQAMPKQEGQLSDYATKYADYVKNPQEEAQAIRGLMFAQYLGGNVASAFVNFTQPMTVSFPYLSQFGGVKGAAAAIGKAMADQSKRGFEYEDGLKEALRIADEQGVTQPQSVHELQAQARGAATLRPGDGTRRGNAIAMASNGLSKLSLGWGKLFGMAEQINRRTTFIAAYRIAVEKGIANPGAFATKAVDETQFINNKGNKAVAARGAIGSTMMTFKSYSINYMELLHRMAAQGGPEGKRAVALAMVMLFLMAGAGGLPFMDDLDDLIDGIAQRMGYNFSSKKAKQEFLEHWIGKAGAQFVDRGITGIAGIPIDIAGRMGMGNLLPGTGLFMPKADHTSDMAEFLGVAADLGKRASQAGGQLLDGHPLDAALSIAPKAIGNLAQGARMMDKGYYQDAKGSKVIDTTPTEAAFKAIGFQPQSVAKVGESNWIMQSAKNVYNLKSQAIRAQWAKGIFENDPAMVESARSEMQAWNEKNPGQRITPNMPAIIRKVKEMRKTKEARIADTSPKAMRAQVRRDIAESHAE